MLLLVDPALGTLDIDDHDRYVTTSVDMPLPKVRDVVEDRTEADGTWDQTVHLGARAVTASVVCFAGDDLALQQAVDDVRAYLHPRLRPTLVWDDLGGRRRRLVVRAASHDVAYSDPRYAVTTVGWVAPGGLIESDELHSVTIPATTTLEISGRTYNLTFDRVYPASSGQEGVVVVDAGSAPVAGWRARLYGPCVDPRLENLTLGDALVFSGLTLARGDYVELDADARTARLAGDPTRPVYNRLDPSVSRWWPLVPGANHIRYRPYSAETGAEAVLEYRDAWL
jgi:hypothetical protein